MQVVILAGGQGTRLKATLGDRPKALAEIGGKPLLEHQILLAQHYGFDEVVLLLGHAQEQIATWAADGSRWGVRIRIVAETRPLGSAGAVLTAIRQLDERFLVMYGDTMLNVDLARLLRAHATRKNAITIFLHPNDHPLDSDVIETDEENRVIGIHSSSRDASRDYPNQVNAGLYVVDRAALSGIAPRTAVFDFGRDLFPLVLTKADIGLYGYASPEYIKDIGTPERLREVEADYASGRVARGSFATPAPAVFLDRDGTINREVGHLCKPSQFVLIEGAAAAIRQFNRAGWRVVVVTNQPVVARGECSEADLRAIHNRMETLLGSAGAYVDRVYYCPHHPDRGFAGERPELKFQCACRKPLPALIHQAQRELNLDLAGSWLIGDTTRDIRTARNAALRSILVRTGRAGSDSLYPDEPDHVAGDLMQAANVVLNHLNGTQR